MTRITEEYRALQQQLHDERPDYGVASLAMAPVVSNLIAELDIHSIIDYGCGKARLGPALRLPPGHTLTGQLYDPGNAKYNKEPTPAELVVCIDVMEHVESGCVVPVLDHIRSLATRFVFFTISTVPAGKVLADGRNAHITLWSPETWLAQFLLPRFELVEAVFDGKEITFVGETKQ